MGPGQVTAARVCPAHSFSVQGKQSSSSHNSYPIYTPSIHNLHTSIHNIYTPVRMRWCHLVSVSLGLSSVAAGVTGPPRDANSVTSSFSSSSSSVSSYSSSTSTSSSSPYPSCGRVRAVAGRARLCNTVEECSTDCSKQNCTTTSQYRTVKCRVHSARILADS